MHHTPSAITETGDMSEVWLWVGMTYLVMVHAQDSDGLAELVFQTATATVETAAGVHNGNQEEATATTDVLSRAATGDDVWEQLGTVFQPPLCKYTPAVLFDCLLVALLYLLELLFRSRSLRSSKCST